MLGFVNVDLDPSAQMNVWMSSGRNHAWDPAQESPATEWEARIDELVTLQAESTDPVARRKAFNEVQLIVQQQAPIIYLVHKNLLSAVSPSLRGVQPGSLWPSVIWNIEDIRKPSEAKK
jgi:peptide/nickel transport system substrate-binding protein